LPAPDEILRWVADYYAAKLTAYGPTARGVDWNSEASQTERHCQLARLMGNDRTASVLDLGCGYGDFLRFLRAERFSGSYVGYDIAPEMITAARLLHGEGEDRRWRVGAVPDEVADYAVASGILNVKGDVPTNDWTEHVWRTLDLLANAGRRGFAFNMLQPASDPALVRPDLFYADAAAMQAYCAERFGPSVEVRGEYGLWEFTVVVRR
jgi:SAM-dependent methyltransferase